ncbi:MAG TPA: hypothetical protein DCZ48_05415 [Methylococcaceae bacterium]|nr:hypothetical protein [Methylococcaceae bacterium]
MTHLKYKLATLCLGFLTTPTIHAANFHFWSAPEQEVFFLVNLQRSLNGLDDLIADSRLHEAALAHSNDMSANDFFSHTGSDNSNAGQRMLSASYNWNQPGGGWGENIAAGYGVTFSEGQLTMLPAQESARQVMYGSSDLNELSLFSINNGLQAFNSWDDVGNGWNNSIWDAWDAFNGGGWMGSSGHRANILTDWFTDLGVGLVFDTTRGAPYYAYWTQNFASGDTVPLPSALWLFLSGIALLRLSVKTKNF